MIKIMKDLDAYISKLESHPYKSSYECQLLDEIKDIRSRLEVQWSFITNDPPVDMMGNVDGDLHEG